MEAINAIYRMIRPALISQGFYNSYFYNEFNFSDKSRLIQCPPFVHKSDSCLCKHAFDYFNKLDISQEKGMFIGREVTYGNWILAINPNYFNRAYPFAKE